MKQLLSITLILCCAAGYGQTRGVLIKWDTIPPTGNITYVKHDTLVVGSPSIQYIQVDGTTYKIVRSTTLKATEPGALRLSPTGIIQGPLPSGITLTPYTQSILPL